MPLDQGAVRHGAPAEGPSEAGAHRGAPLSRRQRTLAVAIPSRRSNGPLHLLIDGTPARMVAPNGAFAVAIRAWAFGATGWELFGPMVGTASPRTEILRASKHLGRALWRRSVGHHRRSRVEAKMHRVKQPGQRLMAGDFDCQVAGLQIDRPNCTRCSCNRGQRVGLQGERAARPLAQFVQQSPDIPIRCSVPVRPRRVDDPGLRRLLPFRWTHR